MTKLKIKNVGPIKNGFSPNNGFMDFAGITLLMGDQGSGKSTVAKVFSTLSWIEKDLVRGTHTISYFSQYNRFKKQLDYQNIGNYLNDNSSIEYLGDAYKIKYIRGKLKIDKVEGNYEFPKIMYVPAERNFVSSVDRLEFVKLLPVPIYTFLEEYDNAIKSLGDEIALPIGKNIKFEYNKQNKKSYLIGDNYKIELLEASSGLQSLVPLFLVTQYLTKIINEDDDSTRKSISIDEKERMRKKINQIYNNKNIYEEVRGILLENLSALFRYSSFLNIVEEPEQNLYPTSQKNILFELLKSKNNHKKNKLVITTHSPYIVNYLTLAIKGHVVNQKIQNSKNKQRLSEKLSSIIPLESTVDSSEVSIYQLSDSGGIDKLPDYKGLPSDENFLNNFLEESNELFIKLLEIEDLCQ